MSTAHAVTAGYHLGRSEAYWNRPPEEPYGEVMERLEANGLATDRELVVSKYSNSRAQLPDRLALGRQLIVDNAYANGLTGMAHELCSHVRDEHDRPLQTSDVFAITSAVMTRERRLRLQLADTQYALGIDRYATEDQKRGDSWRGGPIQRLAAAGNVRARSHETAGLAEWQIQQAVVLALWKRGMWISEDEYRSNDAKLDLNLARTIVAEAIHTALGRMLPEESDLLDWAVIEYRNRQRKFAGILKRFRVTGPPKLR